jgi:hypothetical protein
MGNCTAGYGVNPYDPNECVQCTPGYYGAGGVGVFCTATEAGTYVDSYGASEPTGTCSASVLAAAASCYDGTYIVRLSILFP